MGKLLLDLFCCCGGVSKGFNNIGFECIGVDITDDHKYPFDFIHSDVFKLPMSFFEKFDVIHASPPCQAYILANKKKETKHPKLIEQTRNLLEKTGKPYIIENVIGSPLRKDIILCGEMFDLKVIRHRLFEINGFTVLQPKHEKHKNSVMNGTAIAIWSGGIKPGFYGDKEKQKQYIQKRKQLGLKTGVEDWQKAMDIDWVNDKKHLSQMIPPKYTEYIGKFLV